jgi:hypothetical protein
VLVFVKILFREFAPVLLDVSIASERKPVSILPSW